MPFLAHFIYAYWISVERPDGKIIPFVGPNQVLMKLIRIVILSIRIVLKIEMVTFHFYLKIAYILEK